jgi:protease I
MHDITGKKIAILATDGFEQSEMMVPKRKLEDAGAEVEIVSLKPGEIWGWQHGDWGDAVPVDKTLDGVSVEDYDALVLPGGQINPDLLRAITARSPSCAISMRPRSRSPRSATRLGCWWRRGSPRAAR